MYKGTYFFYFAEEDYWLYIFLTLDSVGLLLCPRVHVAFTTKEDLFQIKSVKMLFGHKMDTTVQVPIV